MKYTLRVVAALVVAAAVPAVVPVMAPTAQAVSCTVLTKNLYPGINHNDIICLEQRLIELGYQGIVGPDTSYGSGSVNAVKHFQTVRGLYPDGIITSITGRQLGLRGALPGGNAARVTVIGDSTSAAMRWYDEANNNTNRYDIMGNAYELLWSVESCRRLVITSCVGRVDPGTGNQWRPISVLPLMKTSLHGQLGEAVVIMAGYDDTSITSAIDQIMAEAKLQGVAKVYWLTYRTSTSYGYGGYYISHNNALNAAKVKHPNLVVLDWNGYTRSQSSATQNAWFENDDIHMTSSGAIALANWLKSNIDPFQIQRCDPSNTNTGVPDPTTGVPTATTGDTGFVPLAPQRVLDTRNPGLGGAAGRIGAGRTVAINLNSIIPGDAEAVSVSVTAIDPCRGGYLTVFACGTRPNTSNLNYAAGRTTAGLAITPLEDRSICVYSSGATDVAVDVTGVFTPGGGGFTPMTPTRWVDTRGNPAVVTLSGPRSAGTDTEVQITGLGGVPSGATAVWLNLTAAGATASTVLTAYPGPCGSPPLASNVNVLTNRSASAATLVGLGATGSVCIRTGAGSSHIVIDVAGWFSPAPEGLVFRAGALNRLYDSRPGTPPPAGTVHQVALAQVSVLNIASVGASAFGFVSAKPCGSSDTSSLVNNAINETTANVTAVAPGTGGAVCISASMATDVVVDLLGEFVARSI